MALGVLGAARNFVSTVATTRSSWDRTAPVSGWSNTVRTDVATHGRALLGTFASRFRRYCALGALPCGWPLRTLANGADSASAKAERTR
jgi:hypothetical protein